MIRLSTWAVPGILAPWLAQSAPALGTAVSVAIIVAAAALAGIFVLLLGVLLQFRRIGLGVGRFTRKTGKGLEPVMDRARSTAENLDFITRAVRTDVERLTESVSSLNDRLRQASDRMEERIEEFNALMEVVQGEAEDIFIDTAAAVRGVRAGTRSLGGGDDEGFRAGEEPDPTVEPPDRSFSHSEESGE